MEALIIIDYQNDFVCGDLGFNGAEKILPNILQKVNEASHENKDIIFTMDTHDENFRKTKHGIKSSSVLDPQIDTAWDIYGPLKDFLPNSTRVFKKNTFGSIDLALFLQSKQYENIEFSGLVSHICVLVNVILAQTFSPKSHIIVDSNCIASPDLSLHQKAIDIMKELKIDVI